MLRQSKHLFVERPMEMHELPCVFEEESVCLLRVYLRRRVPQRLLERLAQTSQVVEVALLRIDQFGENLRLCASPGSDGASGGAASGDSLHTHRRRAHGRRETRRRLDVELGHDVVDGADNVADAPLEEGDGGAATGCGGIGSGPTLRAHPALAQRVELHTPNAARHAGGL